MTIQGWSLDDTKTLKCKVCNQDVPVNINYPITEVTCIQCYRNEQTNHRSNV